MSNEAKVEMVPMLQDMRTYITNHYWSEILCEVEEQLPGFKAQMPPWTQGSADSDASDPIGQLF